MRSTVRLSVMFSVLAALLLTTACSASPRQPSSPASSRGQETSAPAAPEPAASIEVTISPAAEIRGGVLRVTGTTDLVDGALLDWEVGRWSDGSGESFKSGTVTVKNGKFSYSAKVNSIPGRQLYAFTVLASGSQPESVRETYGQYGENLTGAGVYSQGKYRMLETWVVVDR